MPLQVQCLAATFPAQQAALARARNATALADTTAPQDTGAAVLTCSSAVAAEAPPPATAVERFTDLTPGPFQRVHFSEAVDGLLSALFILMTTAATGAVLGRVVRCSFERRRTIASLQREDTYASVFVPRVRSLAGRGLTRASNGAAGASFAAVAFVSLVALVWVVIETVFIFLAIPRQVDITFGKPLHHVVVAEGAPPGNLLALEPNQCRELEFTAGDIDLKQTITIQRCKFGYPLPPPFVRSGARAAKSVPNTTTFQVIINARGTMV